MSLFFKKFMGKGVKPIGIEPKDADFVQMVVKAQSVQTTDTGSFLKKEALVTANAYLAKEFGVKQTFGNKVVLGEESGLWYATIYLRDNGVREVDLGI